jgi:hypothetical protein
MKSSVLKIGLPMAVAAFALASAAGTSSLRADKTAPVPGYARLTPTSACSYVADCDDNGNVICTAPDDNNMVLHAEPNTCITPLKKFD